MSAHPMIDRVLSGNCDLLLCAHERANLSAELRTLLAERDGLQSVNSEIKTTRDEYRFRAEKAESERDGLQAKLTPPTRKLREYKGVTYRHGKWWHGHFPFASAARVISNSAANVTDGDHAAIYALKDDPYLPVETVEEVLVGFALWLEEHNNCHDTMERAPFVTRLRAAVLAEPTRGEG